MYPIVSMKQDHYSWGNCWWCWSRIIISVWKVKILLFR